jgi:HEAT repeat protein
MPVLIKALADDDRDARKFAGMALGKIGVDAATKLAAEALTKAALDSDPDVRRNAIIALGKVHPDTSIPLPTEEKAHRDALKARKDAIDALKNAECLRALKESLSDTDKTIRLESVVALGAFGPEARGLVPDLIKTLQDAGKEKDNALVAKVAQTLGKIGKDPKRSPAARPLMDAMKNTDAFVRKGAALALGEIGPGARTAAALLREHAQRDPDKDVREAAQHAVNKITAKP